MNTQHWMRALKLVALAMLTMQLGTTAHAIDVEGGDYTALPAGTDLAVLYGQYAQRRSLYSQGDRVPVDARLDSDVGMLRLVHYTEVGGHIVNPQIFLPYGRLSAKGDLAALGHESGAADIILAASGWFSQPGEAVQDGLAGYVWLPTGDYQRTRALNLGENRWKLAVQYGHIQPIADGVLLDLVGDVTLFGANNDADDGSGGRTRLTQKPLFALQSHLRYQASPTVDLRLGLFYTAGGETRLGGVDQDNRQSTSKFNLGVGWFVRPTTQLLAMFNRDLGVRDGFRESQRLNLRLLQIF